jgi:succinylglutamate desuccinylase
VILSPTPFFPYDTPPAMRLLGRVVSAEPGPTLLVVAGLHGNEPAGLAAARRFLEELDPTTPGFRGSVVVLAGNLGAMAAGVRFLDRDLNRRWNDARLAELRAARDSEEPLSREDGEQLELAWAIDEVFAAARGPVVFLDLHTTSAGGYPFGMIADDPAQRAFALQFQLPIILGLLEQIDGVLLEWMRNRGAVSLGIEAGRHDLSASADHHRAILQVALAAAGLFPAASVPGLEDAHDLLLEARGTLPRLMKVDRRHAITVEDRFVMEPGFANIQPIVKGQLLARDRTGEIRAVESGLLFMPLYQGLGDDGFFIGRALSVEL